MLRSRLRAAPVTVPALVAVAIFLAWVPFDAGQPITRWAPGTIAVLALLGLAVAAVPGRWAQVPGPVKVATLLLAAFTAWSFLSIAWAQDRGVALEGADRTLLYLAVFALFALWPQQPGTAAVVVGAWTLGLIVFATVTLVRVGTVEDPARLFLEGRLMWPAGYVNAAAALWLMALWPAITLAASPRVPAAVRGLLAGGAVVLLDVALLSQSRGSVLSMPICAALFVAFVPGRLRHIAVLVPIALAAGAGVPAVLDVGDVIGGTDASRIGDVTSALFRTVLLAAVVAGAAVAIVAALEGKRPPAPATARALRRGWTCVVVAGAMVLGVAGLVVAGGPVQPLKDAWHSFKGGYEDNNASDNRLVGGLGSNRYDFYRVSLDVFADHPIAGVGADNFFEDYLVRGDSPETPSYPHNLALRTLSQTGLIGALLLAGAFGAALVAARRGLRRPGPLAVAVAGGAAMAFAYWFVHGMTDWFWEWAGLGAPAFALLGLACALAPRHAAAEALEERVPARKLPAKVVAPVAIVLLLGALVVAGPWLAERDVERAGRVFSTRPFESYDRLDRAAGLDPFSDRPALVAGSIALRYGDLARARAAFARALDRNPRGQYATLELGAIASVQGDRRARELLDRAVALAPRDATAREARDIVRKGGVVDITTLNRRILSAGQRFSAR